MEADFESSQLIRAVNSVFNCSRTKFEANFANGLVYYNSKMSIGIARGFLLAEAGLFIALKGSLYQLYQSRGLFIRFFD